MVASLEQQLKQKEEEHQDKMQHLSDQFRFQVEKIDDLEIKI